MRNIQSLWCENLNISLFFPEPSNQEIYTPENQSHCHIVSEPALRVSYRIDIISLEP